jgi:pyruvate formate lyase activating enzyme
LNYLNNLIDAANIDLKSFKDETYVKYCGAHLQPVLDCIRSMYSRGIHIEITTLVVPGLNDSDKELEDIANFISSINKEIPWHISRFFPKYKMENKEQTSVETLQKAYDIGKKAGLKFVYVGNI